MFFCFARTSDGGDKLVVLLHQLVHVVELGSGVRARDVLFRAAVIGMHVRGRPSYPELAHMYPATARVHLSDVFWAVRVICMSVGQR